MPGTAWMGSRLGGKLDPLFAREGNQIVDVEICVPPGTLVGRAWVSAGVAGPRVVTVRDGTVVDMTRRCPTVSDLLAADDPVALVRGAEGERLGSVAEIVANSRWDRRDPGRPWLLAPADFAAVKACGVTFVDSMLERVIEEQARGDPARAEAVRRTIVGVIGTDLRAVRPGSPEAAKLKQALIAQQAWSQYLEVGIGPDAEVFTKAQPLSAVGLGAEIGIHADSKWNNPEPEVVLAVAPTGKVVGATLGNDVNLRDFEGRSALLLGHAKDNSASCAIGPFIRLFDDGFDLDDVRRAEIRLEVDGTDGFRLDGGSSMSRISRDPLELVGHALGPHHQYPDGMMLFLGTMFAPIQDRDGPGQGFTHHLGDVVTISAPGLGALVNRVNRADRVEPWRFGARDLMRSLAALKVL